MTDLHESTPIITSDEHSASHQEYPNTTAMVFDPEDYRHHTDHFNLSDPQKDGLLKTLWSIMSTFVDLGFGVESVQHYFPDIFNHASRSENRRIHTLEPENPDSTK